MQSMPATSPLYSTDASVAPYPLLTAAEALFYACLENITAQRCHIQCKPRLHEVLHHETVAGFVRICQRHIDFMVYRKGDWLPMVAIEFEDDSEGKTVRKPRDRQLVKDLFSTLGIPILQVHADEITKIDTLVHKLSHAWQERNENLEILPPPEGECPPTPPTTSLLAGSAPPPRQSPKAACSAIS